MAKQTSTDSKNAIIQGLSHSIRVRRVQEADNRIDVTETTCTANETKIQHLEKRVRDLTEQVDDLENRGRRCNVRIIGLPENTEGSNPVRFFEKWIPDYLQVDTKAGKLKLERAHRSLAPKPAQGGRPRPVIVQFHNFQDKQRVMTAATKLFTLNSKLTSSSRAADGICIAIDIYKE
ncbi:LINE-1 type transposase domain-containing protein 1 [Labeo rohita]|uniref:LINE-1 type transposase domain-containing protein 1 n=1 Tax=Labeo rohita TaxID=84645 RepID=A0ABQ8L6A4_LABRO|nr:LINE-1 type transposase domain-containing protein 1 [Labeo rohita]